MELYQDARTAAEWRTVESKNRQTQRQECSSTPSGPETVAESEYWRTLRDAARDPLLLCLRCGLSASLVAAWWLVQSVTVSAQSAIVLVDVTEHSQLDFQHFSGRSGKYYIVETVTAGLATFDYDGDGWLDIYFLNGAPLPGTPAALSDPVPTNRLFRNVGGLQFVDVTAQAGAGDLGFGLGVAAGDYDNDGDVDLFISNYGPNVLLQNNGDGTFARYQFQAQTAVPRVGAGVSLLDIEADGNLDVYFANYVIFSPGMEVRRQIFGAPAAAGPKDYQPDTDTLLHNTGGGWFADISQQSGISAVAGPGMGVVAFDFDGDQDTDIFVCNDSSANFLFENSGDLNFTEIGIFAGVAYDLSGSQQASMGADVADYDDDGDLDLVTTNFIDEIPTLYRNSNQGYFDDVGAPLGLGVASRSLTWGVAFADLDADSYPDLYVAAGHLIDGVARATDTESLAMRNLVFKNMAGNRFQDVTDLVGPLGQPAQVSRGVAADDLDNDGDIDLVVLNMDARPQLIENKSAASNFLQVELVGTRANRDAVGSRVTLSLAGRKLVQEVLAGRGYQGHFGSRLTYGIGPAEEIESLEIQWHGGEVQRFGPLKCNQRLRIIEGDTAPRRLMMP
ncbi:MAG: CRTAC1 family protein [Planctomycetales bacterium]|nr:CRTAC1 family protein [Planctomycetales bacterium]